MFAITSLVLTAVTSFAGGSVDDLAKSLAESTGKNAVIVTGAEAPPLPKFSYDTSTADMLSRTINAGSHLRENLNIDLRMAPGSDPIFSDHLYVADHFREIAPQLPGAPKEAIKVPVDMLTSGKVTLQTAGASPISLTTFTTVKWSKKLRVDYLMRDLAVSASVKDMPERDFLSAVAKGAGGFLTSDDQGYHIAYDSNQLQQRIVETLKREVPDNPIQLTDAKRNFYMAVMGILPFDSVSAICQSGNYEPRIDVLPNSDLATASVEYIKEVENLPVRPLGGGEAGQGSAQPARAGRQNILSEIDNRAMVHLRLNASGEIILSVPVIRGRNSSYIDL